MNISVSNVCATNTEEWLDVFLDLKWIDCENMCEKDRWDFKGTSSTTSLSSYNVDKPFWLWLSTGSTCHSNELITSFKMPETVTVAVEISDDHIFYFGILSCCCTWVTWKQQVFFSSMVTKQLSPHSLWRFHLQINKNAPIMYFKNSNRNIYENKSTDII